MFRGGSNIRPKLDMLPGQLHPTTRSGDLIILGYDHSLSVTVKFIQTGTILTGVYADNIRKGRVSDPFLRTHCNIGYMGIGPFNSRTHPKAYFCWANMIRRVYRPSSEMEAVNYADCSIHPNWHNFQTFAIWYTSQNYSNDEGYELDKDLIIEGNRTYSSEACLLIPAVLNIALIVRRNGRYLPGIGRETSSGKFEASVTTITGHKKYLGTFLSQEEAHRVYLEEKSNYILSLGEKLYNEGKIEHSTFQIIRDRFTQRVQYG